MKISNAGIVQLVEHLLAKEDVARSSRVTRLKDAIARKIELGSEILLYLGFLEFYVIKFNRLEKNALSSVGRTQVSKT